MQITRFRLTQLPSDRQTNPFSSVAPETVIFSQGSGPIAITELSMTAKRVVQKLDSTLDSVNDVERKASDLASECGFDEDEVQRIEMAVREAAVNAVYHGNGYDPNKKMTFVLERTPESIVIVISDEGKGLNESEIPDPLAPENLLKPHGRGIFLMRSFMDEVRIRNLQPGTEITLIKHVREQAADGKEESK